MNGDVVLGSNQQNDIVLNGDFKAIQLIFGRKFNNSMKYQSLNMALAMASNSTFTLPSIAYYHFNISSITSNGLVTLTEVMIDVTSINKNNVVFTKNTGDLVNDDVVIVSNCASFTNDIYKVTHLIADTEFQLATTDDTVLEDNSDLEGSLVRDANALLTSTTGLSATHNAGIYYNVSLFGKSGATTTTTTTTSPITTTTATTTTTTSATSSPTTTSAATTTTTTSATSSPTTTTTSSPKGVKATIITSETAVTSVEITTPGSGYTVGDVLTIEGSDIGRFANLTFTLVADDINNGGGLNTTKDALLTSTTGLNATHNAGIYYNVSLFEKGGAKTTTTTTTSATTTPSTAATTTTTTTSTSSPTTTTTANTTTTTSATSSPTTTSAATTTTTTTTSPITTTTATTTTTTSATSSPTTTTTSSPISSKGVKATIITSETAVTSVEITTPGSGYTVGDVLTIAGNDIGRFANLTFTLVADDINNGGGLNTTKDALLTSTTGLNATHNANTYTGVKIFSSGSGTDAIADVVTSEIAVIHVEITAPGSRYAVSDVLTIVGSDFGRFANLTFNLVANDLKSNCTIERAFRRPYLVGDMVLISNSTGKTCRFTPGIYKVRSMIAVPGAATTRQS